MKKLRISNELSASYDVLYVYYKIIKQHLVTLFTLITFGVIGRLLQIVLMVLIFRMLISLFYGSSKKSPITFDLDGYTEMIFPTANVLTIQFSLLVLVIFSQFLLSTVKTGLFSQFRQRILMRFIKKKIAVKDNINIRIAENHISVALLPLLKSFEILVFYLLLLPLLIFVHAGLGGFVLFLVPFILILKVRKNNSEKNDLNAMKKLRSQHTKTEQRIEALGHEFRRKEKSKNTSEAIKSLSLLAILILLSQVDMDLQMDPIFILVLVFGVRFIISFSDELGRHISQIMRLNKEMEYINQELLEKNYP